MYLLIAGVFVLLPFLFKFNLESTKSKLYVALFTFSIILIYMALHELTHGLSISLLSKTKSTYKLRFPFLTTGTKAYLNKISFIIVCLSSSIIWGILLLIILMVIPKDFILSIYILLGLNFAGSSGDYVQTFIASKEDGNVLINDDGNKTNIYDQIKY